jgi:hypothetical protein
MAEIKRKLVIIGNGFDLAHDLPTSYNSFMLWYFNHVVYKNINENGLHEDDLIKISKKYGNTIDIKISKISELRNKIKDSDLILNFKSQFFGSLIKKFEETNWVDIEYEIFNQIKTHYKSDEHHQYEILNKQIEYLKSRLKEYLLTLKVINDKNESINTKIYNYVFNNQKDELLVLNFNYTNTIQAYKKAIGTNWNFNLINIHGNLYNEEDTLIFGYGDETDEHFQKLENLNHENALTNFKSYWYFEKPDYQYLLSFIDGVNLKKLEEISYGIVPEYEEYPKSKDFEVFVIGHSCGLSDRVLSKNTRISLWS